MRNETTSPHLFQVLLVEDDPQVVEAVRGGFDPQRVRISHAGGIAEARSLLGKQEFHVLLLDVGLPDGNGLELAKELRSSGRDLPILILTAKDALEDRLAGFGGGADDYVCKPFDPAELAARVTALLRRSQTRERSRLSYADVELELLTLTMTRGDFTATLSAREFELLAYLMKHPEEVLSRERLLAEIWTAETDQDSNVVNVYINYLRNKLEQARGPRLIHTVRGAGYMLSKTDPEELA